MNCQYLETSFSKRSGVSQHQRVMDESFCMVPAAIDGRTMADLLDYFVQLSQHINYYDSQLNIKIGSRSFRTAPIYYCFHHSLQQNRHREQTGIVLKAFAKKAIKSRIATAVTIRKQPADK